MRDKIMLLVDPVVVRPLLAEWDAEKAAIAAELQRAEAAKSRPARTTRLNDAERRYRTLWVVEDLEEALEQGAERRALFDELERLA